MNGFLDMKLLAGLGVGGFLALSILAIVFGFLLKFRPAPASAGSPPNGGIKAFADYMQTQLLNLLGKNLDVLRGVSTETSLIKDTVDKTHNKVGQIKEHQIQMVNDIDDGIKLCFRDQMTSLEKSMKPLHDKLDMMLQHRNS